MTDLSERALTTTEDVQGVLAAVSFRPSCVDMGWEWEIARVGVGEPAGDGWLIRTTFTRPDTDSGVVAKGLGGWHFVPYGSSTSGLVKRAFVACFAILEHELREAFQFDGRRVFDPHATVHDLTGAARRGA